MSERALNRPARTLIAGLTVTLVASLTLLASAQSDAAPSKQRHTASRTAKAIAARTMKPEAGIFSRSSVWHGDVRHAPTAPDSRAVVDNLAAQVRDNWGGTAAFNYEAFNVSFFQATPDTTPTTVKFDDCQGKGYVPDELYDPAHGAVFVDVPIPAEAQPAVGTDGEMSVWDPATDQLWEFWQAHKEADGWYACWGGRIDDVSSSPGYFPGWTGVAATALSTTAGAIGIREAKQGRIDHAMSLAVIDAANWTQYSYPAQRSDGNLPAGTQNVIREGQRLRLDPHVKIRNLHLSKVGRMIARAAKRYGFIVVDRAGSVGVVAESGQASKSLTGVDPWSSVLGGTPGYAVMKNFPWDKLQALPVDYGKP